MCTWYARRLRGVDAAIVGLRRDGCFDSTLEVPLPVLAAGLVFPGERVPHLGPEVDGPLLAACQGDLAARDDRSLWLCVRRVCRQREDRGAECQGRHQHPGVLV